MDREIKVAVIYTGMPLNLIEAIEGELKAATKGMNLTILSQSNPAIINDAIANGHPRQGARRNLIGMYMEAMRSGADVILNACSSVGDVADIAGPLFSDLGIPLIRIDEEMAATAISKYRRIGVIATLTSTIEPTKRLIRRMAAQAGKDIEIIDVVAEGTFDKPIESVTEILVNEACRLKDKVDCILLAQGSMVSFEKRIAMATGKPTLSSPRYGAQSVRRAIDQILLAQSLK